VGEADERDARAGEERREESRGREEALEQRESRVIACNDLLELSMLFVPRNEKRAD